MSYLGNPISTMNYPVDYFTGTGTTTTFNLSYTPASASSIQVYVGGVKQTSSLSNPAYYLNGSQLVLSAAPAASTPIEVNYLGLLSQINVPSSQTITAAMLSLPVVNTFVTLVTANGAQTSFALVAPPVSSSSVLVTANGVVQYDYSVSGSNLNLNFTPPSGTIIRVQALGLGQYNVPTSNSVTSGTLAPNLTFTGTSTFTGNVVFNAPISGNLIGNVTATSVTSNTVTVGSNGPLSFTDIYDLDDVSYLVDGFTNVFPLRYNQASVPVYSPFNLLVTINGLIQPAFDYKYDTVWLSGVLTGSKGYCIDTSGNATSNGYLKFADSVPQGSQILMRTVAGSIPARTKTYPFKPLDILMGY